MLLAGLCALAALALLAAPAHAIQLGPEEPHSPNAESIGTAYWVLVPIVLALAVAINAALIVAVVRFRERRGREPLRIAAGRGALRPIVAVLSLLALAIFVFGVVITERTREIEASGPNGLGATRTAQVGIKGVPAAAELEGEQTGTGEEEAAAAAEQAPLQIRAIAQQWVWRFEYPGHQPGDPSFSYGALVVPEDTTVILNIDSTDVNHSWWVPALGGQVQAAPGDEVQTWFKADEVGRYAGRSTIFSGSAYPVMRSWVRVVTAPEYEEHVRRLGVELQEAQAIVDRTEDEQQTPEAEAAGGEEGAS